jgi:hypothetical protein
MARSKKIHVLERNGDFFVEPPVMDLTGVAVPQNGGQGQGGIPADTVRLINHTDEDLLWIVNDGTLFNGGAFTDKVNAKSMSGVKSPVNGANFAGFTRYQVLMLKSGKKAHGNSDPVIIIEN